MAVAVFLAVRLVVAFVVGNQVVEREAIMRCDEVDARVGFAPEAIEQIRRGQQSRRGRGGGRLAPPIIAHRVSILVVPFRPAGWEPADLIAAGAAIPWLRDQLHTAEDGILRARFQEAALIVEAVWFAREDRTEVETEAIDVHFLHPVA